MLSKSGTPGHISTSYVERQNLTLRMSQKRFARLTNGFSKKLTNHQAAVSLYVAHYNLCRVHQRLRWFRTFAMNVSQIYDGDDKEPVEMKIDLEKKEAAN